ncbi:MAG: flagellar biosynthetic protein FliR [Deltaproteobacteria bacterium]|nr:flagellar biosynthetic protein FliR [Deltaproteobacteria bacterium]
MPSFLASINESVDTTRNIVVFALIMARIMAIVVLVPWLGGKSAPPEVKMGIGATLAMVLWPTVLSSMTGDIPLHPLQFVLLMLKEAFVGLIIGFVSAEIFYTVEMAGELIDVLRGANQIQLQVPELNERSSAFGNLQYQLLLALFLGLELHRLFIEALFESFVKIPLNEFPTMGGDFLHFLDTMAHLISYIFAVAITLTVPVAIVCLVVETSFGLLNRVAPQINAYFMAMPAKVVAGIVIYFFAFSMILEQMLVHSKIMLGHLQHMVDLMI